MPNKADIAPGMMAITAYVSRVEFNKLRHRILGKMSLSEWVRSKIHEEVATDKTPGAGR